MLFRSLISLSAILLLLSCNNKRTSLTQKQRQIIKYEVKQMLTDYQAAVKKNGLQAEFGFLDSSSDFYWVPPGYISAISYDSIALVLRTVAPRFRSIDNEWEALQIIPLTENIANYTGIMNSVMVDTTGKRVSFKLIESGNVIKRDAGWKLFSGQTGILSMQ